MNAKDGGPAFPVVGLDNRNGQYIQSVLNGGMTLRDFFAAQALNGICASELPNAAIRMGFNNEDSEIALAKQCYVYADAMLKARDL